jgi:hypothetical protein
MRCLNSVLGIQKGYGLNRRLIDILEDGSGDYDKIWFKAYRELRVDEETKQRGVRRAATNEMSK